MVLLNQLHSLVPRRSTHCCRGNESLGPDTEYFSFLTMMEKGWVREDYCSACWEKVGKEKREREGVEWRGKIPAKKTAILSQDERAKELFLILNSDQTIENQRLAYVLALYLERKKQFQMRGRLKNRLCFEDQETGETFALEKMTLSRQELDQIVTVLLEQLQCTTP